MNQQNSPFPYIIGFIIIVLGFFFLAGIIANYDASGVLQKYWPVLLILLGICFIGLPGRNKMVPFGMIMLGILFVFERAGVFASTNGRFFFGLLLGLLGLVILILSIGRKKPDEYEVQQTISDAEYERAKQILEQHDRQ